MTSSYPAVQTVGYAQMKSQRTDSVRLYEPFASDALDRKLSTLSTWLVALCKHLQEQQILATCTDSEAGDQKQLSRAFQPSVDVFS